MPTESKYDRIIAYLKGLLSNRQRHNLEKDVMQDVFEEEAFEGLSLLTGSELEADMERLQKKLEARIMPAKRNPFAAYLRIAAAIALLIGAGSILYFIVRTPKADLLTQEQKTGQPSVHSVPPPVSVQPESGIEKMEESLPEQKTSTKKQEVQEPVEILPESDNVYLSEEAAAPGKMAAAEQDITRAPESPNRIMKTMVGSPVPQKVYSGTVVDNSGEILPGVVVSEKGTANTTVTDREGNFRLPLQDTNSLLALSYIGYKTLELESSGKPKDKIVMEEDAMALNEVVVVGYGTRAKRSVTGSVSSEKTEDESYQDQPVLTKPVPPGGSLKAFKKWVNERLDYPAYREYPGKT